MREASVGMRLASDTLAIRSALQALRVIHLTSNTRDSTSQDP